MLKNDAVVVDFTASWCGPCRNIAPCFEELSQQYPNIKFVKVDVDEASDVAADCGVTAMPTFHFYKNGKKVKDFCGANKEMLQKAVEELL
ncbi:thioredoxin-like isoform X2 [Protopterus annectens]|nr:thioredoxin-like isoform X2 [Protopterus annectens]